MIRHFLPRKVDTVVESYESKYFLLNPSEIMHLPAIHILESPINISTGQIQCFRLATVERSSVKHLPNHSESTTRT